MPTFIKIGPLEKNLCGITSRGYIISRKGNTVFIHYGSINCFLRKFYWAGRYLPTPVTKKFRRKELAVKYYNDRLNAVEKEEYIRLPPGKKILKFKELKYLIMKEIDY